MRSLSVLGGRNRATDETPDEKTSEDNGISVQDPLEDGAKSSMVVSAKPGIRKGATGPKDWHFAPSPADPLAAALVACLRLNGRDIAIETLLDGLPLRVGEQVSPALAVRAAEGQGFRARVERRALSDLPDAVLPTVLFLADRDAVVLIAREGDNMRVVWPSRGSGEITVAAQDIDSAYAGHALLLRPDAQERSDLHSGRARQRHWFWSAVARHRADYGQVILASVLINLLALATPIFTMNVYDRVFPNAAVITLWSLVAGVGIALIFDALLKWLRARVIDHVGRKVDQSVSSSIFRHLSDLRLDIPGLPSGNLMNTLKDFEQLRDFFSSQTLASLTDLLFAFLFVAVIAYIGGPLALPPLAALLFVLVLGLFVLAPMRKSSNAARQAGGVKNAVAVEAITDLETLKAVGGQGRMQARWEREVASAATAQERSRRLATMATTLSGAAQQASSIGIVVIGVYLALEGRITMGAVIASMILSGRALAPTAAIASLFVRGSFAMSTLRSLNQIMDLPSDDGVKQGINPGDIAGAVTLSDVTFTYPETSKPALADVTLEVAAGSRVGIVGAIGTGKTSLVRLMAGLHAPESGLVLLDGLNMHQIGVPSLRSAVQLVPQEAVLFSGSLAENIAFGMPQAKDADILRAARVTGVDRIAAEHPDGFAMQLKERGRNLSGGQRQLVALARALINRPKVLILDEPTSSMDVQSERMFIARLSSVLQITPMTVIVATHRTGLLEIVDRLIMLEGGRIARDGPKAQIMAAIDRKSTSRNKKAPQA